MTKYMQENPNAPVAELMEKFKASKQSIYNTRYRIRKQPKQENTMVLTAMVTSNTSITDKTEFIMPDPVNHPAHYTDGGIETIDFIEAKRLGYHLGNVVKYICRAGKKGTNMGLQDLQKARWYLDRAIEKNEINPPTR
jgi:hypothetical protein